MKNKNISQVGAFHPHPAKWWRKQWLSAIRSAILVEHPSCKECWDYEETYGAEMQSTYYRARPVSGAYIMGIMDVCARHESRQLSCRYRSFNPIEDMLCFILDRFNVYYAYGEVRLDPEVKYTIWLQHEDNGGNVRFGFKRVE